MSFPTARRTVAACATASTQRRYVSCLATRWRPRATGITWTRWRIFDDHGTCCSRRRLLLGDAGPHPTVPRRSLDARGVYGWRTVECDLSQPWQPCRSDRDHLRSYEDELPDAARVLLPDP